MSENRPELGGGRSRHKLTESRVGIRPVRRMSAYPLPALSGSPYSMCASTESIAATGRTLSARTEQAKNGPDDYGDDGCPAGHRLDLRQVTTRGS